MSSELELPRIVNLDTENWIDHPRFAGILLKPLLGAGDNALANVFLVRIPPGREVGAHNHSAQVESVFVSSGEGMIKIRNVVRRIGMGEIVAIPIGVEHSLRNIGSVDIVVLAFFTPPIT